MSGSVDGADVGSPSAAERFWVIFDTSQYRDYYQDVHNLLALPSGAMMRYEYREDHVSADAVRLKATDAPNVLLAYAQKNCAYTRGETRSVPIDDSAQTLYIGTRLAKMRGVSKRGATYYYDFEVSGYPDNSEHAAINAIFGELERSDTAPWTKWVSSSAQSAALDALTRKDNDRAWSEIVHLLASHPMQFADDAFWRVNGPLDARDGMVHPRTRHTGGADAGRIESSYDVVEHSSMRVEVISESGPFAAGAGPLVAARAVNDLTVATTNAKALTVVGAQTIPLRHHSSQFVAYKLEAAPVFGDLSVDLSLKSGVTAGGWPTGPSVALRHKIVRNSKRVIVGLLMCALGVIAFMLGWKAELLNYPPLAPWGDTTLTVGGVLSFAIGTFALSGKWEFKAPLG